MDEYQILKYNEFADAYRVGTAISNAPVIDFSMDIIEIDGQPLAKRGKKSGSKSVFRCPDCLDATVLPIGQRPSLCKCGFEKAEILKPILSKGQMKAMLPEPKEIRDYVIDKLKKIEI